MKRILNSRNDDKLEESSMVVAIAQARMGSTRLPGKVMREILGKPMLWHVINRLKGSRLINRIVIATTDNSNDKPILELSREMAVDSFAGSEDDVLDRYYQAAKKYDAETVVRITTDCPMIDPEVTDRIIGYFFMNRHNLDYVHTGLTFPDGLDTEVFTFSALDRAWHEARWLSEREHVTPYIKNSGVFRTATVEYEDDLSHMRWVVDDERDLELVTEVFRRLFKEHEIFHLRDVIDFLNEKPELQELNKSTIRNEGWLKSLAQDRLIQ